MIRRAILVAAALAFSLAGWTFPARAHTSPQASGIIAQPVVTGLAFPAAFTLGQTGRIFCGQRFTGQIRMYNPADGSDTLVATIPNILTQGERGLLGLALLPGSTHLVVYAYATRLVNGTPTNQIIR